jgi:hypothetical protein
LKKRDEEIKKVIEDKFKKNDKTKILQQQKNSR